MSAEGPPIYEIMDLAEEDKQEAGEDKDYDESRRNFLIGGAATGAVVAGGVAVNLATGGLVKKKAEQVASIAQGVAEVAESRVRSNENYLDDEVSIANRETLIENETYTIERLKINIEGNEHSFSPVLITFGNSAHGRLTPVRTMEREEVFIREDLPEEALVLPVGYITGEYHRDKLVQGQIPELDFQYPAQCTDGTSLGPAELVDRFPGLGEELNEASGGIILANNEITLADKSTLERAKESGEAFAQMVFYIDQENKDEVMSQYWEHHRRTSLIGNTAYYWSGYFEYEEHGEKRKGVIVNDQEMVSLNNLVQTIQELSPDGNFKFVLADAGNGASTVGRTSKKAENYFAFGVNGFDTHLTPAALVLARN